MRELAAVTQGMCRMTPTLFTSPLKVARLWVHECERVLSDRMVSEGDIVRFQDLKMSTIKRHFDDVGQVCGVCVLCGIGVGVCMCCVE